MKTIIRYDARAETIVMLLKIPLHYFAQKGSQATIGPPPTRFIISKDSLLRKLHFTIQNFGGTHRVFLFVGTSELAIGHKRGANPRKSSRHHKSAHLQDKASPMSVDAFYIHVLPLYQEA